MNQFEQGGFFQEPQPEQGYVEPPRTSGLAISSLVCSLIFCCPLTTIIGPILGLIAFVTIGSNPNRRGKGLAVSGIILGILMTTLQAWAGFQFYSTLMLPVLEGPKTVLVAGFTNDMSAFRGGLADGGARVTDEEIQEFIDQLRSRYGEFSSAEMDPTQPAPPAFGQPIIVSTYLLHFSDSTVSAEVEMIIVDQQTGQFVMKPGVMTIRDPENGDLSFPPLADGQNPDDSSDDSRPDETNGG